MLRKLLIGLVILVAAAAIFFGVTFNQMSKELDTYAPIKQGMEDRFVFFDIGTGDREFLAKLIDSIQQCSPKVLAIDVFFRDLKDPRRDSLLMNSLRSSNVVLATRHDGKNTYAVHESFLKQVASYGYAQSVQNGRYTIDAFHLRQGDNFHFAYEIAKTYDPTAAQIFQESQSTEPIPMIFTRLESQFKVYKYRDFNFNCDEIAGKIAYMGYFGEKEDLHVTRSRYHENREIFSGVEGEPDMHGSIGVANQVLMILDSVK